MMMAIAVLVVLFLVGFIYTFFYVPPNKVLVWIRSILLPFRSSVISTEATLTIAPKEKKKEELESVFATFDKNGDGFISKQELRESLKLIGLSITENEVESMVERLDVNGDGLIDLNEFCKLYESMGRRQEVGGGEEGIEEEEEEEGELREAFDVFDGNGDGLITVEELSSVLSSLGLKQGLRTEDCKEMIRKVDMDGDGMVNFDEFKLMMKTGRSLASDS